MKDITNSATEQQELVSINVQPAIVQTSPDFQQRLKSIKDLAAKSKSDNDDFEKSLQDPNAELNEEALAYNEEQQKEAMSFIKESMNGRKKISVAFNTKRDEMVSYYDKLLEDSGFSRLVDEQNRSKKFKKDALAHRVNKRWEELKQTFDANLTLYPQIVQDTPNLARFSTFRLNHPKLVTGAKAFKVTDRIRGVVNNELNLYATTIENIKANPYNLSEHNVIEMLRQFENRPDQSLINGWALSFQQKEKAEEQRRIEQERIAKIQKENQQKLLEKQQQDALKAKDADTKKPEEKVASTATTANASVTTPVTQPIIESKDPYAWVADYALPNRRFSSFKTNELQKIDLIGDLIAQMQDKNSPVMKNINSPKEMTDLLKYVLN